MYVKRQSRSKKLLVAGFIVFAGTLVLLKSNQMKTTAVCRDVRLFMDGGYSAIIQSGGLAPKTTITVYKKEGRKQVNLGTLDVVPKSSSQKGVNVVTYSADKLNMILSNTTKPHVTGKPAAISGILGSEKFSAQLGCQAPKGT